MIRLPGGRREAARLTGLVLAATAWVGFWGCRPTPPAPPSIVFIVVDTLRADHLPSYGYPRDTAPRFRQLAEHGVVFDRVIAPSSWTKTSMASIMTSRIPDRHHVRGVTDVLPGELPTLATALATSGYRTIGINTNPWLQPKFGFAAGFDVYETRVFAGAAEVNQLALTALTDRPRQPYLLYLHYMDVHAPYLPAPGRVAGPPVSLPGYGPVADAVLEAQYRKAGLAAPGVQERVLALYDAEITATDDAIGQLLDELARRRLLDNTIIVITSDHGEGFREHGTTEHGWNLYPEVYEVPLLIVWTGRVPAGRRVQQQIRSIDIAPTLMELAGVRAPTSFEGRSLLPLEAEQPDRVAVSAVGLNDYVPDLDYVAVVSRDYLYVKERKNGTVELYELRSDPGAQHNLGARHPVAAAYAALVGDGSGTAAAAPATTTLDDLTKMQLRALGYLHDH